MRHKQCNKQLYGVQARVNGKIDTGRKRREGGEGEEGRRGGGEGRIPTGRSR